MDVRLILMEVAQSWNQQGVSIWSIENHSLHCLGEWGIKDEHKNVHQLMIEEQLGKEKDIVQKEQHTLCFIEKWALVFFGGTLLEPLKVKDDVKKIKPWLYLLQIIEHQKRKEDSLNSLIHVAHTIVSSIQNQDVLYLILKTAIDTIPSADTGFLFLMDERMDRLVVKSAVGFRKESYVLTGLHVGEGVSGHVYQTGQPMLLSGSEKIAQFMKNMSTENLKHYLNSTIYGQYPISMISVPLIYQERPIGVLTIDNFLSVQHFSEEDVQLLQALADLAAVVIQSSNLFKQHQKKNHELAVMHQALSKEHDRLYKTIDYHNQLTNIAAKGHGMNEILEALYQFVKVPVAVYDNLLVERASYPQSSPIRLPDQFLIHPAIKLVNKTKKWQRVDLENSETKIIVTPIIGTDRLLGYLCAWTDFEGFKDIGKLIFEYSATVLALDWIKKEAIKESREKVKGQFLEELLDGEINQHLVEQASFLGISAGDFFNVMLLREVSPHHPQTLKSWLDYVEACLEEAGVQRIMIPRGKLIIVIMYFPSSSSVTQLDNYITKLIHKLRKKKEYQVGIGRTHKGLTHISKSYRDAQQCFQLFDLHQPNKNVLFYGELGLLRFLLQQDTNELESFLTEFLGPVLQYDHEKNSDLVETLLVYVQYDKNVSKITAQLNIHYNTLYYRIKRIQELLELSFEQNDSWFNIQLACQIYTFIHHGR